MILSVFFGIGKAVMGRESLGRFFAGVFFVFVIAVPTEMEGAFAAPRPTSPSKGDEMDLDRKKEVIEREEEAFAGGIGSAVVAKPQVGCWMILMPFLVLFQIYDMLKFRSDRHKFDAEFMAKRRQVLEVARAALASGSPPDVDRLVRSSGCAPGQAGPYVDLLEAEGEDFADLVRSAYRSRTNFLLTLNRLNTVERQLYVALKPGLAATAGAAEIIAVIE